MGVLAGGRISTSQRVMRRRGFELLQHLDDLGELGHQVCLVLQAPGRVDQQQIGALGPGLRERIIGEARRIGALLARDHRCAGALAPDLQLLHRRGPERVAGGQHDLQPLAAIMLRQLADGGGLAAAVDADDQHDMRLRRRDLQRLRNRPQDARDFGREDAAGLLRG